MFVKDVKGFQAALFDRISLLSLRFEQNQNFIENFFTKEKFFSISAENHGLEVDRVQAQAQSVEQKNELWLL